MATILIVDDEEGVVFELAYALKRRGHTILMACDGNDALQALNRDKIDLVITDIIMPNREGIETIRDIRSNWPDVKIVAMSSGGRMKNTMILDLARKFGANSVLKKPFRLSEFIQTVDRLTQEEQRGTPSHST